MHVGAGGLPRGHVDEADRARGIRDGEQPAVRTHLHAVERVRERSRHAHERRVLLHDGEEIGAGLHTVLQPDGGDGIQQRAIHVLLGQCRRADPFGIGGERLALRAVALDEARGDREQCDHEQDGRAGQQPAQTAVGAAVGAAFTIGLRGAGIDEGALVRVEVRAVGARPLRRCAEACPAVQVCGLAATRLPEARGVAEPPMQADALAILVQPGAQRRPLADEHLVGDLGGALAERHEPRFGEPVQHRLHDRPRRAFGHQFLDGRAPARVRDAFPELGEPQEDVARHLPLVGRQRRDHTVGGSRNRSGDAAAVAITVDGQRAPVAPLPRRPQGVRQQWQRAGLARDIAQRQFDEAGLQTQPSQPRGFAHCPLQLVVAHRAEQDLVVRHRLGELGVGRELSVQIGAHTDRDRSADCEQRVDERAPRVRVVAQREELLELVDDDEPVGRIVEVERRRGARCEERRMSQPVRLPGADGSDDAGPQHRRLATARRPDDRQQAAGRDPGT
jgi:hypothetical protein